MSKLRAPTPPGVSLSRLADGTPKVEAEDLGGLHWGMGYLHALDRGLQISLMRVLGQGRAAELLDGSDEMVEVDRFFRRVNWAGRIEDELAALDADTLALIERYCAGINARLLDKPPWELRLVGYRPPAWEAKDCLLIARMTGYLTLAQSQAEVERLFVEMSMAGVDPERLAALFPERCEHVPAEILAQLELSERIVPEALRWLSAMPRMMASNNWVAGGSRTRSGAAMLANDPHLEINRLPNVWHLQSHSSPAHSWVGATMPGLPAPLIGRSPALSWGATYTFMDGVDSWVEECRDGARRVGESWEPFEVREEVIARKGGEPITVRFWESEAHGCLDGEPGPGTSYRLSTRWAPERSGSRSLIAAGKLWSATSVEQGMAVLGELETAWNWVLADAEGHIGYQMSGLLPLRNPAWKGFAPAPGWDPAFDWRGFASAEQLPRTLDPECGYIVTANDDLNHLGDTDPINMSMADYRARRIAALLEASESHDKASFSAIQTDVYSLQAEPFMELLRPMLPARGALAEALRDWDSRYDLGSRGASAFELFYAALYREFFAGAEERGLSEEVVRHLQDATGIFIDFYGQCDRTLLDPDSPWLGGRSREDVFAAALAKVADELPQTWGERNQVTLTNMFFAGKLPQWLGFDRGPIPLPGGRATPQQGQIYISAGRTTSFAPSLRVITDMGESRLWTSIMGGASDRRWSRWYNSNTLEWQYGEYGELLLETPPA